jgi:hypothetical protein
MKGILKVLRTGWLDVLFLIGLVWLLTCVVRLVRASPSNITDWLLVYLTGIYALFTLYLALAAVKSAAAAQRSATAMEASIEESRMTRWAQFGASIQVADPEGYVLRDDGSAQLELLNPFEQPVINLQVAMWETETLQNGQREIRYSSMMTSQPRSVLAEERRIELTLQTSHLPESQKREIGELALSRFKEVFNRTPEHTLVLVTYNDRVAFLSPMILVFDLKAKQPDAQREADKSQTVKKE